MPLTVGYNSSDQCDAILLSLRTDLAAMGLAVCGRGRFEMPPSLPALVLVGPKITTVEEEVSAYEARFQWIAVYLRQYAGGENREKLLQQGSDTIMNATADFLFNKPGTTIDGVSPEDMPQRLYVPEVAGLAEALDSLETSVDAAVFVFATRRIIRR